MMKIYGIEVDIAKVLKVKSNEEDGLCTEMIVIESEMKIFAGYRYRP